MEPTPENMQAFVDRMIEAGWIRGSATNAEWLALQWTPKGIQLARHFKEIAESFPGGINMDGLACLAAIIHATSHQISSGGEMPDGRA